VVAPASSARQPCGQQRPAGAGTPAAGVKAQARRQAQAGPGCGRPMFGQNVQDSTSLPAHVQSRAHAKGGEQKETWR